MQETMKNISINKNKSSTRGVAGFEDAAFKRGTDFPSFDKFKREYKR